MFRRVLRVEVGQMNFKLSVDGNSVHPGTIRFIFQTNPVPGGLKYRLEVPLSLVDSEVLEFASFQPSVQPDEDKARNWFFWLGHIISRAFDAEVHCNLESIVANNIHHTIVTNGVLLVEGEASPWVTKY